MIAGAVPSPRFPVPMNGCVYCGAAAGVQAGVRVTAGWILGTIHDFVLFNAITNAKQLHYQNDSDLPQEATALIPGNAGFKLTG